MLPDLLQRRSELRGEEVLYRFANGLTIRAEIGSKRDPLRILGLGSPQGALMNHLANFPDVVKAKSVFEPFAGSGALGLMALELGARHVEFLDLNPRALEFQRANASSSGLDAERITCIEGDIATFRPDEAHDLILANPPFVPTPEGIQGTITSNGGRDGNRFVRILLERLDEFLRPEGEALVCVFQLVREERPLVCDLICEHVEREMAD